MRKYLILILAGIIILPVSVNVSDDGIILVCI
jgi:hypothetical protein